MWVVKVWGGSSVLKVLVCVTWCPPAPAATALTVRVFATGSVQLLCQEVRELLNVPVTALSPVSPLPVTVTDLIVALAAVTVMPLLGSAPVAPLAGVKLSGAGLADGELLPDVLPGPLPDVPDVPDDDVHAAASTPAAQTTTNGASLRRLDRLSCSTPPSHRTGISCAATARVPWSLRQYALGVEVLSPGPQIGGTRPFFFMPAPQAIV